MTLNNKANITDMAFLVIVVLVFVIISLVMLPVMRGFTTAVNSSSSVLSNDSKTMVSNYNNNLPSYIDNMFMVMFVVGIAAIIIGAAIIDSQPAVFILGFISLLIMIPVWGFLANTYGAYANGIGEVGRLPMTTFVFGNLPLIATLLGGVIVAILYGKFRSG